MGFRAVVTFPCPRHVAFAYLSDPANRPAWQSSLRAVEPITERLDGVGARWYDVTLVGVRPLMEITTWDAPQLWSESGRWRGLEVTLTLTFAEVPDGTEVTAVTTTKATGPWRPLGAALDLLGPAVARSDLRRAARLCA